MRRVWLLVFTASVLSLVPSVSLAQQGTADISGRVTDSSGAALPGATVIVRHQDSGLFREAVSGADGSFHFSGLNPGPYEVSGELAGFRKQVKRDNVLGVGRTLPVTLVLEVGAVAETVTVTGESPLVDISSQEIGGSVTAREFQEIPSFNRNFAGYLGMLPGVVATISATTFGADSISVAGQNVRNVNYTMDGSNNNDTFNGGNGGAQARVPVEAVQEFQLLSSQFDAEYGLSSGGIVNSVSKSGTNNFHGAAFAFFQNHKLSSQEYFAEQDGLEEAPSKQQQYGGVLGGPIIRDKAHFFGSVERILLDSSVTTNIPTRPDLNRTDVEISRVWNTYLRGDHQINQAHTWGLRWLRETSPQPLQIQATNHTPSRHEAETDVDWTVVGNLSSVIGSTKVNTFRISAVKEDVFFGNPNFNSNGHDQLGLLPQLNYLSFQDQQSARASRRLDVAYGADNVFAWFVPGKRGDHDLKFGINYLYSTLRNQDFGNENGTFVMNSDIGFNSAVARTYPERLMVRVPGPVDFTMDGHFIGMFAQDRWKLNNKLTINLGARYDIEILPTPNQENPLFEGDPDGYPMDLNNIAPRVGFAWSMDEAGRSALRGGAGVFYQRTAYAFLTNMFSNGRFSDSFTVSFPTNTFDPGPRQGNLPTDPMLLNGPTVNRALLNQRFPPGTRVQNGGTVRFDDPNRSNAFSRTYSIGYERQIGSMMGVSVDFIRSEQRNQLVLRELNPLVRNGTLATNPVSRTNPAVGTVGEWIAGVQTLDPAGEINYNSVQVSGTKRYGNGWLARVSYAYSRGRGNVPTGQAEVSDSQFIHDLRLDNEYGPTAVDRPHILTLTGSYDVPKTGGLKLSGVFRARSGTPFSLRNTTFDHDSNGSTQNEYLAAGTYTGAAADALSPNAIPYTIDYQGGRAGGRNPGFAQFDLRAGYRLQLGGARTLDLFLDVFNLSNRVNFAGLGANQQDQRLPATFLRLLDVSDEGPTRTAQINVRYGF